MKENFFESIKFSLIQRNRFVYIKENVFESTKLSSIQKHFFFNCISKKLFFRSEFEIFHFFLFFIKNSDVTFICPWPRPCQESLGRTGWTILTFQIIWNKKTTKLLFVILLAMVRHTLFYKFRNVPKFQIFERNFFFSILLCYNNGCKKLDQDFKKSLCL